MTNIPHWPCPNNCLNWCRTDGSKTNHHPNCEHVDASLIDVWRVSSGGSSYVTHDEADAKEASICYTDDEHWPVTVTKEKMHREIYEQLPEFEGF